MRHRILVTACSLCLVGFSGAAAAQDSGVEIGGRLGYGIPLGQIADDEDADLDEFASGVVPFWLDLGGRVSPELMVGGFLQLGVGFPGDLFPGCDQSSVDCSITHIRVGAQLHYHLMPFQAVDPWLGAGLGYEWLTLSASNDVQDTSITAHGFEFANLQAGVDFKVGANGGIGPFASLSLGQYDRLRIDGDGEDIDEKALHQWLVLGVRGTWVL